MVCGAGAGLPRNGDRGEVPGYREIRRGSLHHADGAEGAAGRGMEDGEDRHLPEIHLCGHGGAGRFQDPSPQRAGNDEAPYGGRGSGAHPPRRGKAAAAPRRRKPCHRRTDGVQGGRQGHGRGRRARRNGRPRPVDGQAAEMDRRGGEPGGQGNGNQARS